MRLTAFFALLLSATIGALAETFPGFCPQDDPSCKDCRLTCYHACEPPLTVEGCEADCLYCRRESSHCAYLQLGQGPECDACAESCVCTIGHVCNEPFTPPPTNSASPTPGPHNLRDLFGRA
ncbi:hypothetical protein DL770_011871 [Monosporascus sp. CRB-9-2]|nr:hypothetical protein DL770_011871 [Monosporascus sp. CRB-9-2]